MVIENLTRYTPSGKQANKYVPHDMWENEQGEWVKFEDVKELLKPAQKEASSNSLQQLKAEIAAIKSCAEDRRKFTTLDDTFILNDVLRKLSAV